jgi:competence protein ComEC
MGVPAQRVLVMLAVLALATLLSRETSSSVKLAWALAVVLGVDPWAVLSAGFWLSFCAVAVILMTLELNRGAGYVTNRWGRIKNSLARWISIQMSLTISLIPASAYWFAQVSLISPLTNAMAIPWFSFFVTPLALIGVILPSPLDVWAFKASHALLSVLQSLLHICGSASWASIPMPSPHGLMGLFAVIGVVSWMLAFKFEGWRRWKWRFISLCAIFILFFPYSTRLAQGEWRATVLDVGQGSAILIETAHHRLLFDAGPRYGVDAEAGSRIVLPYLHAQGLQHLDALMISHADSDHAGGARAVLEALPTYRLRASLPPDHPLWRTAHTKFMNDVTHCQMGEQWQWDGVRFTTLWPDDPQKRGARNAGSCVLRVENDQHAILLTGDIEAAQERELLANPRNTLLAAVLIAPHHGSRTSSSVRFLRAVAPQEVVFQVGYRNRFGYPHPRVSARYRAQHVVLHRSDRDGAVKFETQGEQILKTRYREAKHRYWMGR